MSSSLNWYYKNRDRILSERKSYPNKIILITAKSRAKKASIDFNLTIDDIIVPEMCPYLEIPLSVGDGKLHDSSPSLDRIDPSKGYTKGNVEVISHLANKVKNNLTKDQLILFSKNCLKRTYTP